MKKMLAALLCAALALGLFAGCADTGACAHARTHAGGERR